MTGQFLGPNTTLAIGTLVPGTGNPTNGLVQAGQGHPDHDATPTPRSASAPRFGMAYDLTGSQNFVLRGGGGLFFDRPSGNAVFSQTNNPPARTSTTLRFGQLQTLNTGGLATTGAVVAVGLAIRPSPAVVAAVEWRRPDGAALGRRRRRRRTSASTATTSSQGINLNAVDFGAAFLPQNQDPDADSHDAGRHGAAAPT